MHDFLIALSASVAIFLYWSYCRKAALPKRKAAADAVNLFVERPDVSESDREKALWFYDKMTRWSSLPIITLIAFPFVFAGIFNGKMGKPTGTAERTEMLNCTFRMYVVRNPATTVVCLTIMSMMITIVTPIAVLTNKIRSIPSTAEVYGAVAESAASHRNGRHAG